MTTPNGEIEKKEVPPMVTPPAKEDEDQPDFDKELEALENSGNPTPTPSKKTKEEELRQATYTAKSTLKRVKELGGDPKSILDEETPATPETVPVDTSNFVTKSDLAEIDARKLAKTEGEFKVIMWYVKQKGMSVDDAHLLANKGRIKKVMSEVNRSQNTVPSNGGAGAGADRPHEDNTVPELPAEDKQRLAASGMRYDPTKKAYVGKKVQYRWTGKEWTTEKI